MAPKPDRSKSPTNDLGRSLMTQPMIDTLVARGVLVQGDGRSPPKGEMKAHSRLGEVVIFCDFFSTGRHFPLNPIMIEILEGYMINFHQLTPNTFVRLGLYFWVSKTCRLQPTAEGFVFAHLIHFQRKTVLVFAEGRISSEGTKAEAQYAPADAFGNPCSLAGKKVEALPKSCPSFNVEEKLEYRAFVSVLRDILKVFNTRDLTEEYVACQCWPLRAGWSVSDRESDVGGIPMPDFGRCFGLAKEIVVDSPAQASGGRKSTSKEVSLSPRPSSSGSGSSSTSSSSEDDQGRDFHRPLFVARSGEEKGEESKDGASATDSEAFFLYVGKILQRLRLSLGLPKPCFSLQGGLTKAQSEIDDLKVEVKTLAEGRDKAKGKYQALMKAVTKGVEKLYDEIPRYLAAYGLTTLALILENLDVDVFFTWLRAYLAILESGSKLYDDMSIVVVAARTLAALVCSLLASEGDDPAVISKAHHRTLRNRDFAWPSEKNVHPKNHPTLPKIISKNFIDSFFTRCGCQLVKREGLRLKEQLQAKADLRAQSILQEVGRSAPPGGPVTGFPAHPMTYGEGEGGVVDAGRTEGAGVETQREV
ncbi:hypothetical protein C2845_PM03G26300 [Panicum miliaceum]|uniref:Uncharacterized protein n=1 Tax=Panicum miliaceum TaxID=4540 RepID=A0A3L6TE36_PANMI|nr:hypothetical protein C2845_PM03G26300 [Panicum miliaceum]